MRAMINYYPSWKELPEVGMDVELTRDGREVNDIGRVIAVYENSREARIIPLGLEETE